MISVLFSCFSIKLCCFNYKIKRDFYWPGTSLLFEPGLLIGGTVEHDCNPQRSIGYYLEALLCLAPFTKHPLHATLSGVTNSQTDLSVSINEYIMSLQV